MIPIETLTGRLGNKMFQYAYLYAQSRKGEIPDVYVQDPAHFVGYKEEIRAIYGQGVEPIDMVSIHVRRGDYVNNPFYVNLCDTDYYERAMEEFPGEKFLIFSDDRDFAAKAFPGIQIYEGASELEDMNAIMGCKGHIIANSSFSWWAAFVSGNKTVGPKSWYSDGIERTKLPDSWIRL
jgi:hypothetical protein